MWKIIVGVVFLGIAIYLAYPHVGAEDRVRRACAQIQPGMSIESLRAFAEKYGMRRPTREEGVDFLVERRTFGRHGCQVTLSAGRVTQATYNSAD
jgi:hypothetical protein